MGSVIQGNSSDVDIIKNNLKPLKSTIMNVVGIELSKGTFDAEEYEVAKKSFYYRHIKFE